MSETENTIEQRRAQAAAQCRVVAHLATNLAALHADFAELLAGGHIDSLVEMNGKRTAELMEELGEILNGMDAVDEDDEWTSPIFAEAHKLWPVSPPLNPHNLTKGGTT